MSLPPANDTAREALRQGRTADAYRLLRLELAEGATDFTALDRAAALFRRLKKLAAPPGELRTLRLAYLCEHTTLFLLPILELLAWRDGLLLEIYATPYGQLRQELSEPGSDLHGFAPQAVIVASHWRDLHLPPLSESLVATIEQAVSQLQADWRLLLERHSCRIIQHSFDLPAADPLGNLSSTLPGGRRRVLREINRCLRESAPAGVAMLDQEQIAAAVGAEAWGNPRFWHLAKQHPGTEGIPALCEAQLGLLRAACGMTRKVLVLDLDNTLWGGIVGEDGVAGLRLGPPDATGEAFQEFQRFCRGLRERGVLLAVCSKNEIADAQAPFIQHEASILQLSDFAAFIANWQEKSENLQAIAAQLRVGLESLLFFDDNPAERAAIRRQLPMVAVPEPGNEPAVFAACLANGHFFDSWQFTDEDRQRSASYAAAAERAVLQQSHASADEFLRSLDMHLTPVELTAATVPRLAQLLGKTNQFNLTSRRHSEAQLVAMGTTPGAWIHGYRLADRFEDFGMIGLLVCLPETEQVWRIDTWLLSCRALGRQVEMAMFNDLLEAARAARIQRLVGDYIPTAKNGQVAGLYEKLGFVVLPSRREEVAAGQRFVLEMATARPAPATVFAGTQCLFAGTKCLQSRG